MDIKNFSVKIGRVNFQRKNKREQVFKIKMKMPNLLLLTGVYFYSYIGTKDNIYQSFVSLTVELNS